MMIGEGVVEEPNKFDDNFTCRFEARQWEWSNIYSNGGHLMMKGGWLALSGTFFCVGLFWACTLCVVLFLRLHCVACDSWCRVVLWKQESSMTTTLWIHPRKQSSLAGRSSYLLDCELYINCTLFSVQIMCQSLYVLVRMCERLLWARHRHRCLGIESQFGFVWIFSSWCERWFDVMDLPNETELLWFLPNVCLFWPFKTYFCFSYFMFCRAHNKLS